MIYQMTAPAFIKGLKSLNKILDKGLAHSAQKKFEMSVLLNSRLAPDQFPLIRQIQIVCDTAKLGVSRLTGKEAPLHDDQEKSLPELKTRIEQVIAYLEGFKNEDFAQSSTTKISVPRWNGQWMTGEDYALHHAVPNFYFHLTTAYSILRHNGVEIGKTDYLGELPLRK